MSNGNPTSEEILSAFRAASIAGTEAGNAQILKLASQPNPRGKLLDACGGSILHLDVDGRSRMAKLLMEIGEPDVSVHKAHGGGFTIRLRYVLQIVPPVNGQEQSIDYEADKAAAKVIEERLRIKAFAIPYID